MVQVIVVLSLQSFSFWIATRLFRIDKEMSILLKRVSIQESRRQQLPAVSVKEIPQFRSSSHWYIIAIHDVLHFPGWLK